jgi:FkbM family methyltransferase
MPLLVDIKALKALVSWPVFSITSYGIVSSLFRQGIRPRTVIDVGANVGQFTVAAANIFDDVEIHAFEPIASCIDKLRANTMRYGNVKIHTVALGASCQKASFHINAYTLASSILKTSRKHRLEFPNVANSKTIMVEMATLDRFFSKRDLLAPVLLKLDVQGAEKLVVEGGEETLKRVDYVVSEASFTPMYEGEPGFLELIEVLKRFNFNFKRPVAFLTSPNSGEILQADILFQKNEK